MKFIKYVLKVSFIILPFFVFSQKKDILSVMKSQEKSWNNGDLKGYMKGYYQSDSLIFVSKHGITYGWENTLSNYQKAYPNKEKMGILSFSDIKVKRLKRDIAFVVGKWKITTDETTMNGVYSLIFRKYGKDWRIISDHTE